MEVRKHEFPRVGTLASPYAAYREMVKKRFPEQIDESRPYAAIALYMRCGRRSPTSCAVPCATRDGTERTDRLRTQSRVRYASGTAGNINIANIQLMPEQIQKNYKEAEEGNALSKK